MKVVLSTKISNWSKRGNFFWQTHFPSSFAGIVKGIVKRKNEKEIFIAVIFPYLIIFDIFS